VYAKRTHTITYRIELSDTISLILILAAVAYCPNTGAYKCIRQQSGRSARWTCDSNYALMSNRTGSSAVQRNLRTTKLHNDEIHRGSPIAPVKWGHLLSSSHHLATRFRLQMAFHCCERGTDKCTKLRDFVNLALVHTVERDDMATDERQRKCNACVTAALRPIECFTSK
jgi:hypothetical protein